MPLRFLHIRFLQMLQAVLNQTNLLSALLACLHVNVGLIRNRIHVHLVSFFSNLELIIKMHNR
jgi:hypothetical protein